MKESQVEVMSSPGHVSSPTQMEHTDDTDIKNPSTPGSLHSDSPVNSETSYRTVACTAATLALSVWLISLNLLLINEAVSKNVSGFHNMLAVINSFLGKLYIFTVVPLAIILPPVFLRKVLRRRVCLVLYSVGGLLSVLHILSAMVWTTQVSTTALLHRLVFVIVQEILALITAICFSIMALVRLKKTEKLGGHCLSVSDQILMHVSQIVLVFVSALLVVDGRGLDYCEDRDTCPSLVGDSPEFADVSPMLLLTLLLVVQLRHYTMCHTGYYTRQRAVEHTRQYIQDYSLSPLEKDLLHEKTLTSRIINGIFTVDIYPRGLCPC